MAAFGVTTLQAAAGALGNGTALDVGAATSVLLAVTGTFDGTVAFEASLDGTTWFAVSVADMGSTTRARAATATAAGLFMLDGIEGLSKVRARVSVFTSGTITVKAQAGE